MSAQLGPPLIGLFAPRPPVRYLAPCDVEPEKRTTTKITGIGEYVHLLNTFNQDYKGTETFEEAKKRRREEKRLKHIADLKEALEDYNPNEDTQVRGDPYKTLFISRLSYEVNEDDLLREFSRYGSIERVRLVRNTKNDKPKGYAFLVFEREKDMTAAYRDTDGIRIKGRRILVDVERGRTEKGWKPTRLGGGRGGRQTSGKSQAKEEVQSSYRAPRREHSERDSSRPANGHSGGAREGYPRDRTGPRPERSERGDRPDRVDRIDRGDRDRSERRSGQMPRNFDSPQSNDRYAAERSRQGRQGIGFERPPDTRAGSSRSYQDSPIGFAPASQPALDPRARQPPTTYTSTPLSSAPSAPWLANSGTSAPSSGRERPAYEDDRDRDYKRRRY